MFFLLWLLQKAQDIHLGSGDQNLTIHQKRIKKSLWFLSISRNAIIVFISAVVAYYFETAGLSPFILSGMLKQGLWIHSVWSSVRFCDAYYKWYIQKRPFTFTLYESRWKRKHSVSTSVNYNLFHCSIQIFWNVVCMNWVSLPTSNEHSAFSFSV